MLKRYYMKCTKTRSCANSRGHVINILIIYSCECSIDSCQWCIESHSDTGLIPLSWTRWVLLRIDISMNCVIFGTVSLYLTQSWLILNLSFGTNFSKIWIKLKCHLRISGHFCSGFIVLMRPMITTVGSLSRIVTQVTLYGSCEITLRWMLHGPDWW